MFNKTPDTPTRLGLRPERRWGGLRRAEYTSIDKGRHGNVIAVTGQDGAKLALKVGNASRTLRKEFLFSKILEGAQTGEGFKNLVEGSEDQELVQALEAFENIKFVRALKYAVSTKHYNCYSQHFDHFDHLANSLRDAFTMERMDKDLYDAYYDKDPECDSMWSTIQDQKKILKKFGFIMEDVRTPNVLLKNGEPHFADFDQCYIAAGTIAAQFFEKCLEGNEELQYFKRELLRDYVAPRQLSVKQRFVQWQLERDMDS